ncbi:MAG TPA: alpha/beta hydrolase [Acidimicrobiia bacterium]
MATKTHAKPHPEFGTELIRDWEPKDAARAYIVLVHGLAEHSGRYERTGSLLADAGFWVRSFDLIGAGGSGGRRWHIDDWDSYHDQIAAHVEWAGQFGKPVILMGHSLGGAICLGYLLSDRPRPDLAVLSAPALAGGDGWQKSLIPIVGKLAPRLSLPNPVKGEHLSRDPAVAEAYFADPLVVSKATLGFGAAALAEIDRLNDGLQHLDIPTLVIHGGDDRLVPTWCTEPLGELDCVDRKVYEGLRHETMNEPEGPQVIADIVAWLEEKTRS